MSWLCNIEEWINRKYEDLNILRAIKNHFPECMVEPDYEGQINFLLPISNFSDDELKELMRDSLYNDSDKHNIYLRSYGAVWKSIPSVGPSQSFSISPIEFLKINKGKDDFKQITYYTLVDNFDYELILKYNKDYLFRVLNEFKPTNIPDKLKKIMMLL